MNEQDKELLKKINKILDKVLEIKKNSPEILEKLMDKKELKLVLKKRFQ